MRAGEYFRRGNALIFKRRDVAGEHRLCNQRQRLAEIQSALAGPFASPFVSGFIENDINQIITLFISFGEDVFGNVDEVAAQFTIVPFSKGLCQFFIAQIQATFQQRISFCNQLHIAIFNTIVNHFHIMTRAIRTDVGNAWFTVFGYSGYFSQNRSNQLIGLFLTTRHNRRTFQSALFTTGNTSPDKVKAFRRKLTIATDGVLEESVTTINNDIALIKIRFQRIDSSVCPSPGLHH